jgi:type III secretory pathway component EscS
MHNNGTAYEYWDYLEGDALVCSALGPPEYQPLCKLNQLFFGLAFLVDGVVNLYNARRLKRLHSIVIHGNTSQSTSTSHAASPARHTTTLVYHKVLSRTFGIEQLAYGGAQLIGMGGTLYSPTSAGGRFGDSLMAVTVACVMYVALLQLRGAAAFKRIVQLTTENRHGRCHNVITRLLNISQSVAAFPITFSVWILLASGMITRTVYYSIMYTLICCAGIRSMIENVVERGRTLIRVNHLQQNAGGGIDALHRRRNILKTKLRGLIILMLGILSTTVFAPATMVLFGSLQSSTQLQVHYLVFDTALLVVWSQSCIVTHKHINKKIAKLAKQTTAGDTRVTDKPMGGARGDTGTLDQEVYTVANESGLSVVGDSEFVARMQRRTGDQGGLFSEIASVE